MARTVDHTDKPPAPTGLRVVSVVKEKGGPSRYAVTFEWQDNAVEELNTCFRLTHTDGSPGTTQCAYADDYEGSGAPTGLRTATVPVPKGEFTAYAYANNQHVSGVVISSDQSNTVTVDATGNK